LYFSRKQEHIGALEEHFSPVIMHTQGVRSVAPQQQPVFLRTIDLYFLGVLCFDVGFFDLLSFLGIIYK